MGIAGSIRKTIAYAKRNGIPAAITAAKERLESAAREPYSYKEPAEEELERQRALYQKWNREVNSPVGSDVFFPKISLVVPCYRTPENFLREMIDSVNSQTYGNWELILADASPAIGEETSAQDRKLEQRMRETLERQAEEARKEEAARSGADKARSAMRQANQQAKAARQEARWEDAEGMALPAGTGQAVSSKDQPDKNPTETVQGTDAQDEEEIRFKKGRSLNDIVMGLERAGNFADMTGEEGAAEGENQGESKEEALFGDDQDPSQPEQSTAGEGKAQSVAAAQGKEKKRRRKAEMERGRLRDFINPRKRIGRRRLSQVGTMALLYTLEDQRIRYLRLPENDGIAENTNRALEVATGDYIALLDHDDLLTGDCLFEVVKRLQQAPLLQEKETGKKVCAVQYLFTDEDKTDETSTAYFDPNRKMDFNLDYFLSNNYCCHLSVFRRDLIQKVRLRGAFDGAQDYDLILRCLDEIARAKGGAVFGKAPSPEEKDQGKDRCLNSIETAIVHIPKVLYHWRSHSASTAANPASKQYAYDAGKRALQEFVDRHGVRARVEDLMHVGFYRMNYKSDIFGSRPDVGLVGGKIVDAKGTLIGGGMNKDGTVLYKGLLKGYSGGFLHRAAVQQDVEALDSRCMQVRPILQPLYLEFLDKAASQDDSPEIGRREAKLSASKGVLVGKDALSFCEEVRSRGYRILWDPQMVLKVREEGQPDSEEEALEEEEAKEISLSEKEGEKAVTMAAAKPDPSLTEQLRSKWKAYSEQSVQERMPVMKREEEVVRSQQKQPPKSAMERLKEQYGTREDGKAVTKSEKQSEGAKGSSESTPSSKEKKES